MDRDSDVGPRNDRGGLELNNLGDYNQPVANAALADVSLWHPELVITDLFMPRMDGLELCRRIRSFSRYLLTEPWVGYRFNPGG